MRNKHEYFLVWFLGIAIDIILRYFRFCFVGIFREPFIMKNTKLLREMLLGMMISNIGFAVVQYRYISSNAIIYKIFVFVTNSK